VPAVRELHAFRVRARRDIMVDYSKWDKMKFSSDSDSDDEAAAAPRPPPPRPPQREGHNPTAPTPPRAQELPAMRLTRELAGDLEALLQRLPADTSETSRALLKEYVDVARSHVRRGTPLSACPGHKYVAASLRALTCARAVRAASRRRPAERGAASSAHAAPVCRVFARRECAS
jgi:hypothetical protein